MDKAPNTWREHENTLQPHMTHPHTHTHTINNYTQIVADVDLSFDGLRSVRHLAGAPACHFG